MPAVNDMYEIKHFTTALGQNLLNVYHYQATAAPGSSADLAVRWVASVWAMVRNILSSDTLHDHVEVTNLNDNTDFTSYVGPYAAGTRGSVSSTPQTTLSFTYVSARTDARSGGKRFGVVAGADIADGYVVGGLNTAIANVEAALESPFGDGSVLYRPRIYGTRSTSIVPGLKFSNPITGVNFIGAYTQNTRKFYTSPGW